MDDIRTALKESLAKSFVGRPVTKETKEEVSLAIKRMLAINETTMLGYSDVKTEILWKTLSIWEKCRWFYLNRLTQKGKKLRAEIDAQNARNRDEAIAELEDEDDELDYEYIRYPWYLEESPKQVIKCEVGIKLNTPIEYIPLSIQVGAIINETK